MARGLCTRLSSSSPRVSSTHYGRTVARQTDHPSVHALRTAQRALTGSCYPSPPAGTCTTGQQLLLFKSGGFVPGKPVLPVTVKYVVPSGLCCGWVYPKKTTAPFWRRLPGDLTHLLRILAATGKRLEVRTSPRKHRLSHLRCLRTCNRLSAGLSCCALLLTFSGTTLSFDDSCLSQITVDPPYVPSAEEKKNPSVYAAAVRSRMARMLNVPEQCSIACEDAKEFYKKKDGRPNGVIR